MSDPASDLLFEIGVEELPSSFVEGALRALPELTQKRLGDLRLAHREIQVFGTPRRLAVVVRGLASRQPDLEEELTGPPTRAAFKDGAPTKAADAFAAKVGCRVEELRRVDTPKGEYLVGTRREQGRPTAALLPDALVQIATAIPFRKSMRWGDLEFAFGRPIQWVVALLDGAVVELTLAGLRSDRISRGHRFLGGPPFAVKDASSYLDALRAAHVVADPAERARIMRERLLAAAKEAGGSLIEDEFLVHENLSLVEEPHILLGSYDPEFLELPERVILAVAKGHQRYFGVRAPDGKLLPRYLAVVNTAEHPENIRRGNDRVMRARLADARFFYREDLKVKLADRREKLGGIVFQKRLGTVLEKVQRVERLARELGLLAMLPEPTLMAAASGAHLAKCDLVTLMVGEFPELEGEMGRAYALAQGVSPDVADVIREHYAPRGAGDTTAASDAGALVAIADRLDTLVGCFGIGVTPTGAADPFGLRRACLGILRTAFDRGLDVSLSQAFAAAYDGYTAVKLDVEKKTLVASLLDFFADRLRGLLADKLPSDAVLAAIAVAADRPLDARARAAALAELEPTQRAGLGEVFKRATNIAREAPPGDPTRPAADAHASEKALHDAFMQLREELGGLVKRQRHAEAFVKIAQLASIMNQYFVDVFVMTDDVPVRENRLRLMRVISETCGALAKLELLGEPPRTS
jgi:glycyl-tRNA synthetase beta chain